MRVWLLEGLPDAEPGFQAWVLELLGFATWAPTRAEVLKRIPTKYVEYRAWTRSRGFADPGLSLSVEVVEQIRGDEVLFAWDRDPATLGELDQAIDLLTASRSDLITTLECLPVGTFDWDPPYERFLPWARWRTVRQVVAHLANTETHYYLPTIGFQPSAEPVPGDSEWQTFLAGRREEVVKCLDGLRHAPDLAHVAEAWAEAWSVRKVLRRLVWHERLHTKSIRRIAADYNRQRDPLAT